MSFLLAGGFMMVPVLVLGAVAVGAAARFAMDPDREDLVRIGGYGAAALLVSLAGVVVNLIAVSVHVPANPELAGSPDLAMIVLVGFGEALTVAVPGLAAVATAALLVSIGAGRLPAKA